MLTDDHTPWPVNEESVSLAAPMPFDAKEGLLKLASASVKAAADTADVGALAAALHGALLTKIGLGITPVCYEAAQGK